MAWRKVPERFPAPLREFAESEWPPVADECLDHYGCRGAGYAADCCPRPGEFCGQLHYEMLARDFGTERLAAARRADAYTRFAQARLSWLGEDDPAWITEYFEAAGVHDRICYAPVRDHGVA